MENRKRKVFIGTVATVGLLAVLPPTGWMVRQQFHLIGGQSLPGLNSLTGHSPAIDPQEQAAAAAHPGDFGEQVALSVQQTGDFDKSAPGGTGHPVVRALLALRPRFGDRPELSAHILRYLTMGDLRLARDQDEMILDSRPTNADNVKAATENQARVSNPASLALALETAQRGEALDPTNAYFTVMRALTLAAERQDGHALDAWMEAAEKTKWDDYSTEEVQGRWDLLEDAHGTTSAISRQAVEASILFPHYARMRDMARFASSCAIRQELAGDTAGGFALRRATARVGALMRVQSKPIIGNLVGIAITKIASMRPGGAPTLPSRTDDRGPAERESQYVAYLTQQGHPEEARWYVAEAQAASQVRSIISSANNATGGGIEPAIKLMCWWAAGLVLLLTTFWSLTLGGVAALAGRARRVRAGQPLRYSVRFSGLAVAAALTTGVAIIAASGIDNTDAQTACAITTVIALPFLLGFLIRLKRGQKWSRVGREVIKGFAALTVTAAALASLIGLAALTVSGIVDRWVALGGSLYGLFYGDGTAPDNGMDWPTKIGLGLIILAIPLMTMLVLAIRSRILRIPLSVGLVRGMRGVALPTASALLLLYAIALVGTRVQEAATETFVESVAAHEGQFEAGLVNLTWPEKVTLDAPAPPKTTSDQPAY